MSKRHSSRIRMGWGKPVALGTGILVTGLLLVILGSGKAYSMSSGLLTGRSTTGCGPCHGAAASPSVKVTISGPSTLAVGNTGQYTVTVSGNPEAGGGVNASVTGGQLSAGENTQLASGEITQKDKNSRSWTFSWTAGTSPGQFSLNAAGNAVNKDGSPAGDGWNLASLNVSVAEAPVSTPPGGGGSVMTPVTGGSGGNIQPAPASPAPPTPSPAPKPPSLSLKLPEMKAGQGSGALTASLKDGAGKPITGASVKFYVDTDFFLGMGDVPVETSRGSLIAEYGAQQGTVKGLMEIGEARTNNEGVAVLRYTPALVGDLKIVAKYAPGNQAVVQNTAVWQGVDRGANYHPEIGIRASFLNPKVVLGVILGSIWWLFLFVLYQVFAISREKAA